MVLTEVLDVTQIEPRLKHPSIFQHYDNLSAGEAFTIHNDHDPRPLFYELQAERGSGFTWEYLKQGPEIWEVKIGKKEAVEPSVQKETQVVSASGKDAGEMDEVDVTRIVPREKHPSLFRKYDSLQKGEGFLLINDHDPKPFYYQLIAERGAEFSWTYLEKGPQWWRVLIKKNESNGQPTVGEIAAKDIRKAEVLKKRGIDFCCGGKKTLKEACAEAGVDVNELEKELQVAEQTTSNNVHRYDQWELDFLADYVFNTHHRYIRESAPIIQGIALKVAAHHGSTHPELHELTSGIQQFLEDLNSHLIKEERVVFPYIKQLVEKKNDPAGNVAFNFESIQSPIQMMEMEHQVAGEDMAYFRRITDNYSLPEDACNSYSFLFGKLKEFEEDLQQHIHLENNILFPKALKMEKELKN